MQPETVMIIGGIIFGAVALFGGGFTAKEVSFPPLTSSGRIISAVLAGVLFISGVSLAMSTRQQPVATASAQPANTTSTPSTVTTAAVTTSDPSEPTSTSTSTSTSTTVTSTTDPFDVLIRKVASTVRDGCQPWEEPLGMSVSGAECDPATEHVHRAWFADFSSLEETATYLDRLPDQIELESAPGEIFDRCRAGGDVVAAYYRGEAEVGRVQCFTEDDTRWLEWTVHEQLLWGAISGEPEAASAMVDYWLDVLLP